MPFKNAIAYLCWVVVLGACAPLFVESVAIFKNYSLNFAYACASLLLVSGFFVAVMHSLRKVTEGRMIIGLAAALIVIALFAGVQVFWLNDFLASLA